ncbi:sugar ABC transporter ATP-binding protein [Herbaspirillum sp. GCM10030257]|uniref:sugar ABC transporter ATP-binding protein n=1 Tax=Herbaspirillum sp. GCM10030257 TaxID=3273393 RepID=UPI00361F14A3
MKPANLLSPGAPALDIRTVSKRFGSNLALDNVSLSARHGSIHAVTGENGAGKSTLMKLLAGVHVPDNGEILMDGHPLRLTSPASARAAGISTVFQELTVLPNLTVAENITLGRERGRFGILHRAEQERVAIDVLLRAGIELDHHALCGRLSIGDQQLLEIAKGIAAEAKIFIFDEPTAPLNRAEVDKLERLLRQLAEAGKIIFYISHRLEEIFRFCDHVTVLKDGRHVSTQPIGELTSDCLVSLMVGRPLQSLFPPRVAQAAGEVVLEVSESSGADKAGMPAIRLRRGEIVGIAGLEGQGQRELMRTIAGSCLSPRYEVRHGKALAGGMRRHPARTTPAAAVEAGIALVPEDRKKEGLYLDLSIYRNLQLGRLRNLGLLRIAPKARQAMDDLAASIQLRAKREQAVGALSGGNQQKVMIGRWLASGVGTLLIEQPTRGVDVGAKAEIYRLLREFTAQGGTVLTVSGDLLELIGLCDRILVIRGGTIVAEVEADNATEETILTLALQESTKPVQAEALYYGDRP